MRRCAGTVLVALIIFTCYYLRGTSAYALTGAALNVSAEAHGENGTLLVTISVSQGPAVRSVLIELHVADLIVSTNFLGDLNQGDVVSTPLSANSRLFGTTFVMVRGTRNSHGVSIAATISTSDSSKPVASQRLNAWLPAVASLMGVVIGAFLLHFFTASRETRRRKFEWAKSEYERHAPAYTSFLANWDYSLSAEMLSREYAKLRLIVPISPQLHSQYQVTLSVLEDPSRSAGERQVSSLALGESVLAALSPGI